MATKFRALNSSVGHVLSFTYNSGTIPGSTRNVYITEIGAHGNLFGWDFDKQDVRQFKQKNMSNVYTLEDDEVTLVKLNLLPLVYHDGEQLKRHYIQDGNQVYVDADKGFLVAIRQTGTRFSISRKLSGVTLNVEGKGGQLNIEIPKDREVIVATLYPPKGRDQICHDTTAEKLVELLKRVV